MQKGPPGKGWMGGWEGVVYRTQKGHLALHGGCMGGRRVAGVVVYGVGAPGKGLADTSHLSTLSAASSCQ